MNPTKLSKRGGKALKEEGTASSLEQDQSTSETDNKSSTAAQPYKPIPFFFEIELLLRFAILIGICVGQKKIQNKISRLFRVSFSFYSLVLKIYHLHLKYFQKISGSCLLHKTFLRFSLRECYP